MGPLAFRQSRAYVGVLGFWGLQVRYFPEAFPTSVLLGVRIRGTRDIDPLNKVIKRARSRVQKGPL